MKSSKQSLFLVVMTMFLSTFLVLGVDWYHVHSGPILQGDIVFWVLWLVVSIPGIFIGFHKKEVSILRTFLLTASVLIILLVLQLFLLLNFHTWIGGSK